MHVCACVDAVFMYSMPGVGCEGVHVDYGYMLSAIMYISIFTISILLCVCMLCGCAHSRFSS